MTFTWEAGRQLKSAASGGTTTTYKYNSAGIRTSKTVGSVTTEYSLYGSQVYKATTGSDLVMYFYDQSGAPVSFRAKSGGTYASYYYVKNLQGDIVAITNSSGVKVVEYTYDAWGKTLSTTGSLASTVGASNPYRYRGYWYDTETGLYYLQSRYYDPQTGRFINADIMVSTGQGTLGSNMFAYCENDPVSRKDDNGDFWESIVIGFFAGVVGQYVSDVVSNIQEGATGFDIFKPTSDFGDYIASGIGCAVAAFPGLGFGGTMAAGAMGNVLTSTLKGNINSADDLVMSAAIGAGANAFGYLLEYGVAAIKTNQISNLPRYQRKTVLLDEVYKNSQSMINQNLKHFASNSFIANTMLIKNNVTALRIGAFSILTSSAITTNVVNLLY